MIRLIADSGSTKTDWALLRPHCQPQRFATSGLNPSLMSDEAIVQSLTQEVRPQIDECLLSARSSHCDSDIPMEVPTIHEITFYGAGCRPEQIERMQRLLLINLSADKAIVASDLLGAAHATCDTEEGVVCILGTGSGSGLYDGQGFAASTPSLGYILGDEGSGASLGKHLLADVWKQQFSEPICRLFRETYPMELPALIERVYREASPNRFLATFTHFLAEQRRLPEIHDFLLREFRTFFRRNIHPYRRRELRVHFVGSVAAVFSEELREAANAEGIRIGQIERNPLDALLAKRLAAVAARD